MKEMKEKIFNAIRSYEIIDDHGFSKPLPLQQVMALTELVLAAIQTEKGVNVWEPPNFDCDT